MVILYAYLRQKGNLIACIPFRYNIDNEDTIECREVILDTDPETTTYDSIKQELLGILDKEKQDYGKLTTDLTGDMSSVVTIE